MSPVQTFDPRFLRLDNGMMHSLRRGLSQLRLLDDHGYIGLPLYIADATKSAKSAVRPIPDDLVVSESTP